MSFPDMELTMSQQFEVIKLKKAVEKLSEQEAKQQLIEVVRILMIKGNIIKHYMAKELGAEFNNEH